MMAMHFSIINSSLYSQKDGNLNYKITLNPIYPANNSKNVFADFRGHYLEHPTTSEMKKDYSKNLKAYTDVLSEALRLELVSQASHSSQPNSRLVSLCQEVVAITPHLSEAKNRTAVPQTFSTCQTQQMKDLIVQKNYKTLKMEGLGLLTGSIVLGLTFLFMATPLPLIASPELLTARRERKETERKQEQYEVASKEQPNKISTKYN